MSLELAFGYFTGIYWIAPDLGGWALVRTALLIHVCDAVMCRVFARNNGYPKDLWTVVGLIFGIWAVAILLVLPDRSGKATDHGLSGSPPNDTH